MALRVYGIKEFMGLRVKIYTNEQDRTFSPEEDVSDELRSSTHGIRRGKFLSDDMIVFGKK